MSDNSWRVGIDVGGTFTDVVAYRPDTGALLGFKVPSDSRDASRGFSRGLEALRHGEGAQPSAIVHGTTLATNAVLEHRGAVTGLLMTRNFRDVLEIGRASRFDLYNLRDPGRPAPLVPRDLRAEISERVAWDGRVVVPLRLEEVPEIVRHFTDRGVEAIAICLLHSYAHPEHERRLETAFREHFRHVTTSTDVNAEYREFERASTTVLNAYVMPLMSEYLDRLSRDGPGAPAAGRMFLVQSNGGVMSVATARNKPLHTVMSGPAAGVTACQHFAQRLGLSDAVTLDMGGTSTDVCLIHRGEAVVSRQRRIAGHAVRFSSVAIETIGAGGGSIAWLDGAGALKVGPRSAGAQPGPACYGLGGDEPTVTDANLVLGYLEPMGVLGGVISLDRGRSVDVISRLAEKLGVDTFQMAEGILEVVNSNMIRALRVVSVEKGFDVRRFPLVAFGGAGPLHAGRLAQRLQIPRVVVPAFSSFFSAFGCLVADLRHDAVQTMLVELTPASAPGIERGLNGLKAEMLERLRHDAIHPAEVSWMFSVDLRYVGQRYELEVPIAQLPGPLDTERIRAEYHRLHAALYSYATDDPVECVNLRVRASVATSRPPLPRWNPTGGDPIRGHRRAYFRETGQVEVPIFDRARLGTPALPGPAIVADAWSTTVVYPQQQLRVDDHGNLWLENPAGRV